MYSSISTKAIIRCLILISATVLLSRNPAFAADRVGDAQMQAGDLLAGTVNGRPKTIDKSLATAADRLQPSYPDAHAQARQLILGKPGFGSAVGRQTTVESKTIVSMSAGRNGAAQADPQEQARRMILGSGGNRKEENTGEHRTGMRQVEN
jgi:hypothetical protein